MHFDVAKTLFDIVAYYKNLTHQNIISDTPFTEMEYLVIKDESGLQAPIRIEFRINIPMSMDGFNFFD